MIKVKSFKKLKGNSKKYEITFEKNGKMYVRKFGAAGMSDYTIHKDKERRERYISRHKKDLRTNDPMKPGYLSMYILWNKPSINASLADYKRRLGVYNKTGKFPKGITGSKKLSFGAKYQELLDDFSNKIGPDPARMVLEPYIATGIQGAARSRIYSLASLRADLESMAMKEYEKTKSHYKQLKRPMPKNSVLKKNWLVLNPLLPETARWLTRASKILKITNIDPVKRNLWWTIVEEMLKIMQNIEINGDPSVHLPKDQYNNYEKSQTAIMTILNTCGYPITDDDIDEGWVILALSWWRKKTKDKILNKLSFGTKLKRNLKNLKSSYNKFGAKNNCRGAKGKLKQMLWKLHAKYENPAAATDVMRSGRPWTVLDPVEKKTSEWLNLAADCLTLKDYKTNRLWANAMWHVVDQLVEIDPDNNSLAPESRRWVEVAMQNLELILNNMGLNYDIERPEWYNDSATEIADVYNVITSSRFGKKYKVPDNVVNKKLYESIKSKIKRDVKGRRWGAYDSGRLVREYKAAGGKYKGTKGKTNLSRWYKEKWVDACAWPKRKPCGRKTKKSIAYCRPSKKVDSKTPKLVQKLTAAQRKSRCARKKKAPMKRITKFGQTTPDEHVGNGWVIHCNHVPGLGPHATLRQKQISGPTSETDHAFRYGIKTPGQPPEFWASGALARSGTGLPNVEGQQLLMNYYYNRCGGYNTRELPPPSPAPWSSAYLNSFGNKKKKI